MPFTTADGSCTGTLAQEWTSATVGGDVAALQDDGSLVLYATGSAVYSSQTCDACTGVDGPVNGAPSPPAVYQLYLPGSDSVCTCQAYMCIVVDLPGGGVDYYYAETDGQTFTKTLSSPCP